MAYINEFEKSTSSEIIEYEIECPRCYGIMCLCSKTDTLLYVCEECDLILNKVARKKDDKVDG